MIEFTNVSKTYETGNRAIRNINLRIEDGEFVFLTGRSGSGKSTLIKLITRELKPTEGEIRVNGYDLARLPQRNIPRYRRSLGVVFQDFRLLNDRNVFENIAFAQRVIGASGREIRENVPKMLQLTGLSAKYKNMPFQLSGGEQQRVAIARALINQPSVILADEPTGNLDERNSAEIMKLLLDINRMGTTVIVITHSRELVESFPTRVIVMEKGHIIKDSSNAEAKPGINAFFSDYKRPKDRVITSASTHTAGNSRVIFEVPKEAESAGETENWRETEAEDIPFLTDEGTAASYDRYDSGEQDLYEPEEYGLYDDDKAPQAQEVLTEQDALPDMDDDTIPWETGDETEEGGGL